jgi:hypothetical protein
VVVWHAAVTGWAGVVQGLQVVAGWFPEVRGCVKWWQPLPVFLKSGACVPLAFTLHPTRIARAGCYHAQVHKNPHHHRPFHCSHSLPLSSLPQVCNLSWSKNVNELVSTHGYSQNQIIVWRYPTMQKLATLTGHTMRVLYLAVSPDGQTIVTGGWARPSPPGAATQEPERLLSWLSS